MTLFPFPRWLCYRWHRSWLWTRNRNGYYSTDNQQYIIDMFCTGCEVVRKIIYHRCNVCKGYFQDKHRHETSG